MELTQIIARFSSELKERLNDKILGIYLFGSAAKGSDTEESDIDILVVYSEIDEHYLLEIASKISFNIACQYGRLIETIPMAKQEFEKSLGSSPFLWEVLKFGKPIFTTLSGTEWDLDFKEYIDLADEYLDYAKDALQENKIRLSIDSGYNACELLVKALIISTKNPLSSSHGGIVGQFGKLFVLTKNISEHLGRNLNLALDLRAKARYRPRIQLESRDAEFIINLAQELLLIAKKELKRQTSLPVLILIKMNVNFFRSSTSALTSALTLTLALTCVFSLREVRLKIGDYYFKQGKFDQAVNWYQTQQR